MYVGVSEREQGRQIVEWIHDLECGEAACLLRQQNFDHLWTVGQVLKWGRIPEWGKWHTPAPEAEKAV